MSYYDEWYPPSKPIETDEGLKARSKRGEFAKSWWATRWIEALERLMDPGRLRRGKRYARQGQVLSLEEATGGVVAKVQGSRRRPYRVDIALEPLTDAEWERVTDALSERALFAARLLSGEMPEDIEEAFRAAGVSLFPAYEGELETSCNCPDWAEVCKHTAAVHYILAERFDEDPFLLFRLRGRSAKDIIPALTTRRSEGPETAEPDATPLEEQLDAFWEAGPDLDAVKISVKPPAVPLPALRRLGPPGFTGEDLERLLGPAYEAVSNEALRTALGKEEREEEA
ncbi:MAG: SWIM zinc finger family protein [Rubrobacteraceae bacterium]